MRNVQFRKKSGFVIFDDIWFNNLSEDEVNDFIDANKFNILPESGYIKINLNGRDEHVHKQALVHALSDPNKPTHSEIFKYYMGPQTMVLNGSNRIDLIKDQAGGDLQQPPKTSFQKLFHNDLLREQYRNLIFKGLGSYPVIDPTKLGSLRLRLSSISPSSPAVERSLSEDSIAFFAAAQLMADASDGAKAFAGILSEILTGDPKILLMDEPEAFLHPALAFKLGYEIAQSLIGTNKQMFVSTHSAQFLMGCIQAGVPINVVRLTYHKGNATARLLPSDQIVRLMRNPLLRSVGVISALFYENVVVTEGDPDRAFYQEINERLLQHGRGIPNCIFLNAQNKQTIPTIVIPLRSLGIPAASIYDIDFLKCKNTEATKLMDAAGVPQMLREGMSNTRNKIDKLLSDKSEKYSRNGGIKLISGDNLDAANTYFDQLENYGTFLVRNGELESWLENLGVKGHGPKWLIPVFEKMGKTLLSQIM